MSWAAIAAAWQLAKPWVKKYGPALAALTLVIAVLGGTYSCGHSKGVAKERGKRIEAEQELEKARETAQHNADEALKKQEQLDRQNKAIEKLHEDYRKQAESIQKANARALEENTRTMERRVRDIQKENEKLREEMKSMTPAESCHRAWLEVLE